MVADFRLVVTGEPALVVVTVVMSVAHALSSVVAIAVARLAIFRIIVAVLVGVPGFIAMDLAKFACELWRSLSFALRAFIATVARQLVASITIRIVAIVVIIAIVAILLGAVIFATVPRFIVLLSHAPLRIEPFRVSLLD